jgi:hypothetical protein
MNTIFIQSHANNNLHVSTIFMQSHVNNNLHVSTLYIDTNIINYIVSHNSFKSGS